MSIKLEMGNRVRLTELGGSRSPKIRTRTGVVVAFPKPGSASINVLFDGNKRPTMIHRSYIELDDSAKVK